MKSIFRLLIVLGSALTVLIILFFPSCTLSPRGITILDGDYIPPQYIESQFSSTDGLTLFFTEKICRLEAELQDDTTMEKKTCPITAPVCTQISENIYAVPVAFVSETQAGFPYTLFGCAQDESGNTITFSLTFAGYNNRIPPVILNEVRTEYTKPKSEFVELRVLEDGNIGGLTVYNACDGEKLMYVFPSVEVKKGEFIVLHYRTLEEACKDELLSLDESGGTDSCPAARDFWVKDTKARIGLQDVILIKSSSSGSILDALLLSESGKENWKTAELEKAARSAYECGAWSSGWEPKDAFCSDNVTTTRTINRQIDGSWITAASGGASPGRENSTKAYTK